MSSKLIVTIAIALWSMYLYSHTYVHMYCDYYSGHCIMVYVPIQKMTVDQSVKQAPFFRRILGHVFGQR